MSDTVADPSGPEDSYELDTSPEVPRLTKKEQKAEMEEAGLIEERPDSDEPRLTKKEMKAEQDAAEAAADASANHGPSGDPDGPTDGRPHLYVPKGLEAMHFGDANGGDAPPPLGAAELPSDVNYANAASGPTPNLAEGQQAATGPEGQDFPRLIVDEPDIPVEIVEDPFATDLDGSLDPFEPVNFEAEEVFADSSPAFDDGSVDIFEG